MQNSTLASVPALKLVFNNRYKINVANELLNTTIEMSHRGYTLSSPPCNQNVHKETDSFCQYKFRETDQLQMPVWVRKTLYKTLHSKAAY